LTYKEKSMKNYSYKTLFISLFTLSLVGCNDNLNITPEEAITTDVALSTPENIRKILNNAYGVARYGSSYGGGIALASELLANTGDIYWNGTYIEPAEFDEKAMLTDNANVESIWMNAYSVNNQSNIVLEHLDIITDATEKTTTEGEAKFLRGLVYFDLARLFAKPYLAGSQNSQLAVPIVLKAVLDPKNIEYPSRNTLEEVYALVISDLTDAYSLLPESNTIYATKYSAAALLARVYLQKGDYTNAGNMANIVIENSGASLAPSFSRAFNNAENSSEDLFAWQVTTQDISLNNFNVFWAGTAFGGRSGNPDIDIEDQHYEIYDDANDERSKFFYEADFWCTTKWQNQFANIPFLRLAEMYLIRAESNFRNGTSVGLTPVSDLNILRARSSASFFNTVDLSTIRMERKRELSFEGFALFDAKRLRENIGTIPFNAANLIMPIPLREMDTNPNLVQNEGY